MHAFRIPQLSLFETDDKVMPRYDIGSLGSEIELFRMGVIYDIEYIGSEVELFRMGVIRHSYRVSWI
jgi:hypothetical protein